MDKLGPYLLGPNDVNQGIYTGDARVLSEAIPDESVDLIFTDPVYQNIEDYQWLAKTAARILRLGGCLLVFYANELVFDIGRAIEPSNLVFKRNLIVFHSGVNIGKFVGKFFSKTTPCLVYSRDNGGPIKAMWDISVASSRKSRFGNFHQWGKDPITIGRWINSFTKEKQIVVDFFCGGGVVPANCKLFSRRWVAFEINSETAEIARDRVDKTKTPLFTLEPEQLSFDAKTGNF